jgi:hypothetical protein
LADGTILWLTEISMGWWNYSLADWNLHGLMELFSGWLKSPRADGTILCLTLISTGWWNYFMFDLDLHAQANGTILSLTDGTIYLADWKLHWRMELLSSWL